jgi:peptide/nickel transport system substrate-binding protein
LLPQPDIATNWEYKDPKTLEFTLRQGARFHNGREVVAEDVKYSLERILDPKSPASFASYIQSIESIETPDRYHVVLRLSRPDAALLNNLTIPAIAIVPREAVEQAGGDLKTTMVGSGPFKFKENIPDQRLVLAKNPDYFVPGQPLLDEIVIIPLPNATARTNALRSGEVDYIEPVPPKDFSVLRNDRNVMVTGGPMLSFLGVSLNNSRKPFDDLRVRQALAWGVNRDEVVQKAFDGLAKPLLGPPLVPPFWAGNTDQYYKYDPEKAKQLLAEAGYPNGFKVNILSSPSSFFDAPLSVVLQSELKKLGIDLEITVAETPVRSRLWADGDFDMFPIQWWGSDYIDPDGAFRSIFTCKGTFNRSRGCNEKFDELMDKGVSTTDVGERKQIYREAMKVLADHQPWLFLVSVDRYQAMKSYVKGYTAYANANQYSFREVWLDK